MYLKNKIMTKKELSDGVVHTLPADVRKALTVSPMARAAWEDITPLARNEWVCWVENAKYIATRNHRIEQAREKLLKGKRRPCCWAGCTHRRAS